MSKLFKFIASIFKGIYTIIDKLIVTPVSKVMYYADKRANKSNSKIEKVLNRPNSLLFISLILSIIFFILIDSKVINLVETEAEIITNQPIRVEYNSEAYVIDGVPENIDITLIGRKSDLYLAKQLGENEVVLDLTDYVPREDPYRVKLTYNQTIDKLNYKLDPTYIYVTIKKKVSNLKNITYDVTNQDKLNQIAPELSVSKVLLNKTEVVVKGSQDVLDSIASVKALVDLNNKSFNQKGTYTVENVPIVAYDEKGNILDSVEVVPSSISATITFTSYSKEVPLEVQTTGELIPGKAISSLTINNKSDLKVTIYGDEATIDSIESVPVTIDLTNQGANGPKTYNVTISKPSGVRHMNTNSATIVVNFGEAKQKTIDNIQIRTKNVPTGLAATAIQDEEGTSTSLASVTVIGTQSVIDSIKAEDIEAYIDLSGYTTGVFDVKVKAKGKNNMASYVVTKDIKISITEQK